MARHDPTALPSDAGGGDVANLFAMQQEAMQLIQTRLEPRLTLLTNDAESKATAAIVAPV